MKTSRLILMLAPLALTGCLGEVDGIEPGTIVECHATQDARTIVLHATMRATADWQWQLSFDFDGNVKTGVYNRGWDATVFDDGSIRVWSADSAAAGNFWGAVTGTAEIRRTRDSLEVSIPLAALGNPSGPRYELSLFSSASEQTDYHDGAVVVLSVPGAAGEAAHLPSRAPRPSRRVTARSPSPIGG